MMVSTLKRPCHILGLAIATLCAAHGWADPGTNEPDPRNIILMICDGCGFNHVAAASLYEQGETGGQIYEQFPVKLAMSTHPTDSREYDPDLFWSEFDAVVNRTTDSAAAITAMTTSVKTRNGALCVTASGDSLQTLCERMEQSGRATGVVTSVQFANATPAGFAVCHPDRDRYLEISRSMILDSRLDVIMGTGHPLYDNSGSRRQNPSFDYVGGRATWDALVTGTAGNDADGDGDLDLWTLVQEREDFQALASGPTHRRIIGIAKVRETLQQERNGDSWADPFAVPFTPGIPSLAEMTRAALNVLDDHPGGFCLLVEGGAADWASHDNEAGRMIEEMLDFQTAVAAVLDWVAMHSNWQATLVIVTSDHETGCLAGPEAPGAPPPPCPFRLPLVNRGPGRLPGLQWYGREHSNDLVPFYARGVVSEKFLTCADKIDPVRGPYLDNTELGEVLRQITRGYAAAAGASARTR